MIKGKQFFTILWFGLLITLNALEACASELSEKSAKRTYQTYKEQKTTDREEFFEANHKRRTASEVIRLSTPNDHISYLQKGIATARNCILITSYGVHDEALTNGNLYTLLDEARRRGVRIYVYNIDSKVINHKVSQFLNQTGIKYAGTYTHAKLFVVDECMAAIGSYSWFAKENTWDNATLCLSGRECRDLIPLIWKDLKYYRNLQFDNIDHIEDYEEDSRNYEIETWNLGRSTTLSYIHSLESHQEFIEEVFNSAQQKIIFCSPFISSHTDYQEDFNKTVLKNTLKKKVHLYFVCRTEDPNLDRLRGYSDDILTSPFMHLVALSDIHLKTVLVDDELIAEGSFNWFSACRDEENDAHNHEVTLVLDGDRAKDCIRDFYASSVGQEIMRVSSGYERVDQRPATTLMSTSLETASSSHIRVSITQKLPNSQHVDWQVSAKGNLYCNIPQGMVDQQSHHIVVIKRQNNSYSAIIDQVKLEKWYGTIEEAKIAAFNTLVAST